MVNVCVLTWEYPPKAIDGVAHHCFELSKGIAGKGFNVHIVTHDPGKVGYNLEHGVHVHRVHTWIHGNNLLNWMQIFNCELKREASNLYRAQPFDLIHAHDWFTVPAAVTLKHTFRKPYVFTVHSTEEQQRYGVPSYYSQAIRSLEQQGVQEAIRVLTLNEETKRELVSKFGVSHNKVEVIQPFDEGWFERVLSVYKVALMESFNQ